MKLFGDPVICPAMRGLVALLGLAFLTGCVSTDDIAPAATELESASAAPAFSFSAEGCTSGGFASSYDGTPVLAGAWQTADIREEIGNPIRNSVGMPVTGPLFGNWHLGIECDVAQGPEGPIEDFEFGWVGQMIEPPAFDVGGADMHFLLTGLAFDEGPIGEALRAATTADVTHVEEVTLDWLTPKDAPRSAISARFVDRERGIYESWSTMQHYRDVPDRVVRFWWQVPADGTEAHSGHQHSSGTMEGKFNPIFFDMTVAGGAQYVTPPADSFELASHNMLKMEHGPVLAQPCHTLVYEQPTLSFALGHVIEGIELDEVWTH